MSTAFATALGLCFQNPDLAVAAWWLPRAGAATAVRLVARTPAIGELRNRAPTARPSRVIRLEGSVAAAAGDLVGWAGQVWQLGGQGDPDQLGLSLSWIATAFDGSPAFRADGCPLLAWNGSAWVAA